MFRFLLQPKLSPDTENSHFSVSSQEHQASAGSRWDGVVVSDRNHMNWSWASECTSDTWGRRRDRDRHLECGRLVQLSYGDETLDSENSYLERKRGPSFMDFWDINNS